MTDQKKLAAIRDLLESAGKSVSAARKILATLAGEDGAAEGLEYINASGLNNYKSGTDKIVEGVFTGDSMLGSDGAIYPVPQNYASKSHLVQGSKLKAIIASDGKITYKIIEEIPYDTVIGLLTMNREKYQVVSENKTYNVLMASVTFLKAEIGDTVSVRIPKGKEATYAAVDAIIPKEI
ncbi:MAG: hypothetical protein ACOYN2_02490 [Patescibacteria group bacterium]